MKLKLKKNRHTTQETALECGIRLKAYLTRLYEKGEYDKIEKIFDYADSL